MTPELFQNPPACLRSIPFWSWNCRVTRELIEEQLDIFKDMGFGGVCIHPRAGLDIEYLSEEYLDLVAFAVAGCESRGLLCWLYDDDRFPSGAADGLVTRDYRLRGKYLLFTESPYMPGFAPNVDNFHRLAQSGTVPKGYYLTAYALTFRRGILTDYRRLLCEAEIQTALQGRDEEHRVRFAWLALLPEQPWFEGQSYLDTTDPAAVHRFIEVTHERFSARLGTKFGKSIRAIFTDEPRMEPRLQGRLPMTSTSMREDFAFPYTEVFAELYRRRVGSDVLDILPEVVWDCSRPAALRHRWQYRDLLCECFTSAFLDQIGIWCRAHGLPLSGHILGEDDLACQTRTVGEAMRCYRSMDIPGIDVLVDQPAYVAAKQAASVTTQLGKCGTMSELYGATNWDCRFLTYKLQGDWQAALGITIRVPHLAHMSLEGEAKRDWPASIFYQSPWASRYRQIEDYFARLMSVLREGRRITRVAVLHPVESVWLCSPFLREGGAEQQRRSAEFNSLFTGLLHELIDADLISESLLAQDLVDPSRYEAVVLPPMQTIRATSLARLKKYEEAGGQLVVVDHLPDMLDALPADLTGILPSPIGDLTAALSPYRDLRVVCRNRPNSPRLFYQLRQIEGCRWLFLCHTVQEPDSAQPEENEIILQGSYRVVCWDAMTGQSASLPAQVYSNETHVFWHCQPQDSLLLQLYPLSHSVQKLEKIVHWRRAEPNVLLLDRARYSLDGEELSTPKQILLLDNELRHRLGWLPRAENMYQPWAMPPAPSHTLHLYYRFTSQAPLKEILLGIEAPEEQMVLLNGKKGELLASYYVDKSIRLIRFRDLPAGESRLILRRSFTPKTNLETLYLLGDFDVRDGNLVPPGAELSVGDLCSQGMPFYTGNLEYTFEPVVPVGGRFALRLPNLKAPLAEASVDGGPAVSILAGSPVELGHLCAGSHILKITLYGNRFNGFGALHNADSHLIWCGPDSYRTKGENWTDEYRLRPTGLLAAPEFICLEEDHPCF